MIKIFYALLISLISFSVYGQTVLRAGMGIHFQNTPSLNDYLNQNFSSSSEQIGDFNSVIVFSAEGGTLVAENTELALEVAYLIGSYSYSYTLGQYEFFYNNIMPSLIGYYVMSGAGYQIKFGAGAGIRFFNVEETYPGTPSALEYSSTGFGILIRADGNTLLGGNFYANIGVDARYDFNGEPDNNGEYIENKIIKERVNMNALSFGVRLGLAYIF